MNIRPKEIAQIKAYLTEKAAPAGPAKAIASFLNEANLDNPSPQADIPNPFTFRQVMECLGAESVSKMSSYIHLRDVISDIRAKDREAIVLWCDLLSAAPIITAPEALSISKLVTDSVKDPNYRPKISWIELQYGVGQVITEDEVTDNILK